MPRNNLLHVVANVNTTNIQRAILTQEAAHAAHVIAVIAELVASEAVDVGVEEVQRAGKSVQVFAFVALGAEAAREEEAEVRSSHFVGSCVAGVERDVAA